MNGNATPLSHSFDQVVGEFETGRIRQGVLLLAGMLDAAASDRRRTELLRLELADHPLRQFLAAAGPFGWSQMADRSILSLLAAPGAPTIGSRCGQEIADTVMGLGFARALQDRRRLGAEVLGDVWRCGKRIALCDSGCLGELEPLVGVDLGNVALRHADLSAYDALLRRFGLCRIAHRDCFDLILASCAADSRTEPELAQWLRDQAQHLASGGTLFLSSFAPAHLGSGWQKVCLAHDPVCHDSAALERCAAAAGLTIRTMQNAAGSLVWAELGWPPRAAPSSTSVPSRGTP